MLKGKTAYITGGSKGIGFGIAEVLIQAGVKVAISGRNEKDLEKALKKLAYYKGTAIGVVSDVSNFGDEEKSIKKVLKQFGKVDIVVANAGVGHFKPIDELSIKEWNNMLNTNLSGVFHTLKGSLDALKESQGYFISISSLAGTNFFESGAGYNASKFGVVGFTQAAMLDLRKYNIKVSTIMPGSVATEFNGNQPSEKDAWKIQPEDIGKLVLDLVSMNPRTLPSKIELRPSQVSK